MSGQRKQRGSPASTKPKSTQSASVVASSKRKNQNEKEKKKNTNVHNVVKSSVNSSQLIRAETACAARSEKPNALQAFMVSGDVSSQKNLKMKQIVYLDSSNVEATPYQQFHFDLYGNSPFFGSKAPGSQTACRVLTAKFYALPRWNQDTAGASTMMLFSVPCYTSAGWNTSTAPTFSSVSQRSTLLTPAIDAS